MADLRSARIVRVTLIMSCLFAAHGVVLPYLSRWLEVERGLDGAQIGIVLSLSQLARVGVGPLIAFWADGVNDRRTPIRVIGFVALVSFAGFFFLADNFWMLLAFGFVALTANSSLAPFIEGAMLRAAEEGRVSYGIARGLGSATFIIANVAGGLLIAQFGIGAVVTWVIASWMLFSLMAGAGLQPDPPPGHAAERDARTRLDIGRGLLRSPRFLLLILSCGLIQAAHAFYYGFSTLVWRAQEIDAATVGWLWGFGVAAEIAFLWSLPFIEKRMPSEGLIILGGLGAAVRWLLLGFAPTGLVLWPIQALHAFSFAATHVGAMRLLFRETPENAAGLAQTLYSALASGLFMGLSTLASGVLYDAVGAQGYWAMGALALTGALLALPLLAPVRRGVGRVRNR